MRRFRANELWNFAALRKKGGFSFTWKWSQSPFLFL